MAMFGVLLLASVSAIAPTPVAQVLVAFDARTVEPGPQAEVQAPKRVAAAIPARGATDDAPAPRPVAAPPAPVPVPVAAINLAPRALPIETLAVPLASVPADDAGGVTQAVGSGNGGSGAGGASGSEAGGGRKLFVSWAPSMNFSRDNRYYPQAARAARVEGVAWLRCLVIRNDRVRNCTLVGEEPQGYGFGAAALRTVPGLRLRLHDERGERVYDDWAIVTSTFTLDDLRDLRQAQRESEAPEPAALP